MNTPGTTPPLRIGIDSDGTPAGTTVVDLDSGAIVRNVARLEIVIDASDGFDNIRAVAEFWNHETQTKERVALEQIKGVFR